MDRLRGRIARTWGDSRTPAAGITQDHPMSASLTRYRAEPSKKNDLTGGRGRLAARGPLRRARENRPGIKLLNSAPCVSANRATW